MTTKPIPFSSQRALLHFPTLLIMVGTYRLIPFELCALTMRSLFLFVNLAQQKSNWRLTCSGLSYRYGCSALSREVVSSAKIRLGSRVSGSLFSRAHFAEILIRSCCEVFSLTFEAISAYGTVGLSLGNGVVSDQYCLVPR